MVDDARQPKNTGHNVANDQDFRVIRRDLDGTAEIDGTHINGGYNNTTTEAWESFRVGQVNLDNTDQAASGSFLSEIQSTAYHDAGSVKRHVGGRSGPRPSDDIGIPFRTRTPATMSRFMVLDSTGNALGYRGFARLRRRDQVRHAEQPGGAGRVRRTGWSGVCRFSDTGDLIVVEEGVTDAVMPGTGTGGPGLSSRRRSAFRQLRQCRADRSGRMGHEDGPRRQWRHHQGYGRHVQGKSATGRRTTARPTPFTLCRRAKRSRAS